eukprot:TRINITY_DN44637_c0_g1_i1.p1 TRINITY_DN44637_c0_g1~~TRINITY_DN44637_c0_g1_i1.p1  ORF type:complete len:256 (+),score=60.93 TRINITY_DN44637_c0_g1_i1:52-819(+)
MFGLLHAWGRILSVASLSLLLSPAIGEQPLAALSNGPAPSYQELARRPTEELKAFLKSKGFNCKDCADNVDILQRVLDTWDHELLEAVSPDGKVHLTKEVFVQKMKRIYIEQLKQQAGEAGGHELADDEDSEDGSGPSVPNLQNIWRDFSAKVAKGEAETDSQGHLVYEFGQNPKPRSLWDRWKTRGLICLNITMLVGMQWLKRRKPSQSLSGPQVDEQAARQQAAEILNMDSEDGQRHRKNKSKIHHKASKKKN